MYECPVCKQQINLTKDQEIVLEDKEINIKCNCGFLNIMVGAEFDSEYNGYLVYSYDMK